MSCLIVVLLWLGCGGACSAFFAFRYSLVHYERAMKALHNAQRERWHSVFIKWHCVVCLGILLFPPALAGILLAFRLNDRDRTVQRVREELETT